MGIHKGTKLTDAPKDITIRARVDSETLAKLDKLVLAQNSTRSDVIRRGIDIQFDALEK